MPIFSVLRRVLPCLSGLLLSSVSVQASFYPAIWGDNEHEWITAVAFGDIEKTSDRNPNGYGNYTYEKSGLITRVHTGVSYPLSVSIHPDTGWCDEYIFAFFDWNRDGDFTDSDERVPVAVETCSSGPHAVSIRVPPNAVPGRTRMRVVVKYFGAPLSYGDIPEGEAEDYSLFIEYPALTADNRLEWITGVAISDIDNETGQEPNGYGNYTFWKTGRTTEVVQDESYPLAVTIFPDPDWCEENITAFIDWNQDGDFSDYLENVVAAAGTCDPGPHAVDVRVPIDARVGLARMRIVLRWKYAPLSAGYISGEGEDYTLLVKKREYPWPMFLPAMTGQGRK